MKSYKESKLWEISIELVKDIYEITKSYPIEEVYGLVTQLRRVVVSIPSNIAEGSSRDHKEYLHFLNIVLGSLSDLDTKLIISRELKYINEIKYKEISNSINEIRMDIDKIINPQKLITKNQSKIKNILYWLPAIIWMLVIFYFSSQPASESGALSMKIANLCKTILNKFSIQITLTDLHFYIRKIAHFSIYFILSMLISFAFYKSKSKLIILKTISICLLIALFDEYNQLLTLGRYGSIKDVIIDFSGAFVGAFLFKLFYWINSFKMRFKTKYS